MRLNGTDIVGFVWRFWVVSAGASGGEEAVFGGGRGIAPGTVTAGLDIVPRDSSATGGEDLS